MVFSTDVGVKPSNLIQCDTNLCGTNLCGTNLCGTNLCGTISYVEIYTLSDTIRYYQILCGL